MSQSEEGTDGEESLYVNPSRVNLNEPEQATTIPENSNKRKRDENDPKPTEEQQQPTVDDHEYLGENDAETLESGRLSLAIDQGLQYFPYLKNLVQSKSGANINYHAWNPDKKAKLLKQMALYVSNRNKNDFAETGFLNMIQMGETTISAITPLNLRGLSEQVAQSEVISDTVKEIAWLQQFDRFSNPLERLMLAVSFAATAQYRHNAVVEELATKELKAAAEKRVSDSTAATTTTTTTTTSAPTTEAPTTTTVTPATAT